ncbi:MAG: DUF5309 domain-containing protein [Akkermansia sp.]|nr:DUF5309 domain-containing protein [Akkermansia sp.]
MAFVSGQLKEAGIQGKPRDIMDEIFSVAPTDTPFLSMCGRSEASQALHEWQTDDLVLPGENERLEGADTTEFTSTTSTELNNRTQILSKAINVSGTAQAVRQAGVEGQYAYQMALRTKELKRDVEYALLHNKLARPESGDQPRLMTGLPCWFTAENSDLGASGKVATSSTAAVAGTARVPTEAALKALLTKIYNAGGNPDRIMMSPEIRVKMSEVLTGGATKMEKAEEKTVHAVIDVYVSDFGTLKLVPNRVQSYEPYAKNCAFVLDPEYWKVAYLRGFKEEKLAKTGDSLKGQVIVECTLEARNPASSGMLADLTASA